MRLKYTVLVEMEYKTAIELEVDLKNRIFLEGESSYLLMRKRKSG